MELRSHISKQGTLFLAGKTDITNEKLISQVNPEEIVFHTNLAGSPFVNIKGIPKEEDIIEAAIFCARYSRDWKKNNTDIVINQFIGKNIYKNSSMKAGTFGVKKIKNIKIKKEQILEFKINPAKKGQLMDFEKRGIIKNYQQL